MSIDVSRPFSPQIVYKGVHQRIARFNGYILSNGKRGVIIGLLNDACGGDEGRYELTGYLFGKGSTIDLSDAEWYALSSWVSPGKELIGGREVWVGNRYLDEECAKILGAMGYNGSDKREAIIQKHLQAHKAAKEMTEVKDDLDRAIEKAEAEGLWAEWHKNQKKAEESQNEDKTVSDRPAGDTGEAEERSSV